MKTQWLPHNIRNGFDYRRRIDIIKKCERTSFRIVDAMILPIIEMREIEKRVRAHPILVPRHKLLGEFVGQPSCARVGVIKIHELGRVFSNLKQFVFPVRSPDQLPLVRNEPALNVMG